jgi:hypothetical protein
MINLLYGIIGFLISIIYFKFNSKLESYPNNTNTINSVKIFSKHELKSKDRVLLSILGHVFDVTEGKKFYSEGGSYEKLARGDYTRAYATGIRFFQIIL